MIPRFPLIFWIGDVEKVRSVKEEEKDFANALLKMREEAKKEAERRLRPYACGVGECQRRYKNMNGLRKWHTYDICAHAIHVTDATL